MTAVPFWVSREFGNSLWDELWLGGTSWPGVWKLETTKSRQVDKAKSPDTDGITLTDKGYNASEIKATGIIWKSDQLSDEELGIGLAEILPNFDPRKPGQTRTPLDIYHPSSVLAGISNVYIEKIHIGHPENGILKVQLDLVEWFPETKPAKQKNTPKGFSGTNNAGAALSPADFEVTPPSAGQGENL